MIDGHTIGTPIQRLNTGLQAQNRIYKTPLSLSEGARPLRVLLVNMESTK